MSHFGPEEAIARIDDWKGKDVRYEELGGGITNHNYIVWVDGGPPNGAKYVLRVPGQGTDMFIDRDVERDCMIQADKVGVGPRVAYQIDPEGSLVIDFVEGEIMHPDTIAGHPERIRQVVETVKIFHERAVFKNRIALFDMLRKYTKIARDINAPMPPELESLLLEMDVIEKATAVRPPADVACHNDLLSENFIVDANGKMWVIDWEYGGMTDPYFDLGDFCVEHPLSDDEERSIITRYCGAFREDRYARMMLHKIVADLWWSIWAWIQVRLSKIDFDFYEYGMGRVARLRANAAHPGFATWLATV
jgi:thiamine kinase-like enzyme